MLMIFDKIEVFILFCKMVSGQFRDFSNGILSMLEKCGIKFGQKDAFEDGVELDVISWIIHWKGNY